MIAPVEKMALFIDGDNLYATTKKLGINRLQETAAGTFDPAVTSSEHFYYTAVIEDQGVLIYSASHLIGSITTATKL